MERRLLFYDTIFILIIELLFLFVYLFGPTPNQFPFFIPKAQIKYFWENLSQFFAIIYIPYLPELMLHIYNLNIAIFFGLSIIWIPSVFVLIWLIRELFVRILHLNNFKFYYAYFPILFTLFMPHTLLGLFTFNGSHLYSTLSQIFIMFVSILSAIIFYISGEKKYFGIAIVSILLINIQTFSMTFFILSFLFLIFSFLAKNKEKAAIRSLLLIVLAVFASFIYLYATHRTNLFPYQNLSLPSIGPTDPNLRVFFLSTFSKSRGLWNIFTMQNYVNDPYFPLYYSDATYTVGLFIITVISLFPFFHFSQKLRSVGTPIYLSLISFELMNSFANPFISLIFPQNISIFYDLSYVLNNNTVFYYPLQILAALSFLISLLAFNDFLRFVKKYLSRYFPKRTKKRKLRVTKYCKPVIAVIFATIMVSPILVYDAHHGEVNPVPPQDYEAFITYFNNQKNASVYFVPQSRNQVFSLIQTNLFPIENPQMTVDQVYPLSNAMSQFNSVKDNLQPKYMDYILHMFGYNYLATSNSTLSKELGNSGLFTLTLNYSGVQVLKVIRNVVPEKIVLLSSSVRSLLKLVNGYHIFPNWIYSKYLLNLKSLKSIFTSGIPVYSPNYVSPQDLFPFVNDSSYLIPARYTSNTYYLNRWEIGYLPQYAQETWTQNIPMLKNYSYQSELNVNYGYIFTSGANVSMDIQYSLAAGKYAVLANYLKSNVGGEFSISLSGKKNVIETKNSSSYFVSSFIGCYTSGGEIRINITNIKGFNTISYLSFVPFSNYTKYTPIFRSYLNESSVNSIYTFLGVRHIYNLTLSAPYVNKNLTYQQLFYLNRSLQGINTNLSNILFTYGDGTPIYAFIQSISNGTNGTTKVWLRLNGECSTILHMIVFKHNVSLFGEYLGEAPSLSPSYGEYFNAPHVFGNATSPNAWDWVNSYEGWVTTNASATYVHNGINVNGTIGEMHTVDGGVYLPTNLIPGDSFTVYGWTQNGTVIQVGVYGFIGEGGYYNLQYYPQWSINLSVPEQEGLFYNFSLQVLNNQTLKAELNGKWFKNPSDPYPLTNGNFIWLRETSDNPQYYEFAFIRSMPFDGIMPNIKILSN